MNNELTDAEADRRDSEYNNKCKIEEYQQSENIRRLSYSQWCIVNADNICFNEYNHMLDVSENVAYPGWVKCFHAGFCAAHIKSVKGAI